MKASIEEHGYTVAHLQLCDGGMKDFGYESDFTGWCFRQVDEVRMVSARYPELVSYLPLKIAVIAEKDETLLTVSIPRHWRLSSPTRPLQIQLDVGKAI